MKKGVSGKQRHIMPAGLKAVWVLSVAALLFLMPAAALRANAFVTVGTGAVINTLSADTTEDDNPGDDSGGDGTEDREPPYVDKLVSSDEYADYTQSNSTYIGDNVYYRVYLYTESGVSNYVLHLYATGGLTFDDGSITVSIGGTVLSEGVDYLIVYTDSAGDTCTFEVVFLGTWLSAYDASTPVLISYSMTANDDAIVGACEYSYVVLDHYDGETMTYDPVDWAAVIASGRYDAVTETLILARAEDGSGDSGGTGGGEDSGSGSSGGASGSSAGSSTTAGGVSTGAQITISKTVSSSAGGIYASANSAHIGDTVYFRITLGGLQEETDYVLHVYTSGGLTLNSDSIQVMIWEYVLASGTDYTIRQSEDGCAFEIILSGSRLHTLGLTDQLTLDIFYTMTVNGSAVVGTDEYGYLVLYDDTARAADWADIIARGLYNAATTTHIVAVEGTGTAASSGNAAVGNGTVSTGDDSPLAFWLILAASSFTAMVALLAVPRRGRALSYGREAASRRDRNAVEWFNDDWWDE